VKDGLFGQRHNYSVTSKSKWRVRSQTTFTAVASRLGSTPMAASAFKRAQRSPRIRSRLAESNTPEILAQRREKREGESRGGIAHSWSSPLTPATFLMTATASFAASITSRGAVTSTFRL
jgi:hypothetical protein